MHKKRNLLLVRVSEDAALWNLHISHTAGMSAAMLRLPHCGQTEAGNTQQQASPRKNAFEFIHSATSYYLPLYNLDLTKGTLNIQLQAGKCCGQAVKNIVACLLFTERLLWGRTT